MQYHVVVDHVVFYVIHFQVRYNDMPHFITIDVFGITSIYRGLIWTFIIYQAYKLPLVI